MALKRSLLPGIDPHLYADHDVVDVEFFDAPEGAEKSSEPLIRFVGAGVGEGAVVCTR